MIWVINFFYLTSLSCRDPVNPSSPIFGIINVTETSTNSVVAWKFNQIDCKKLYLHCKVFKTIFKPVSHLMSISHRGPVNPSTPAYGNINLTETMRNPIKNGYKNLYLHPKVFKNTFKPNSHLPLHFLGGLGSLSSPTFPNINLTKTMTNLFVWKIKLVSFIEIQNQIHICCRFLIVAQ